MFCYKILDCNLVKISSAPIPHFRKWPFPDGEPFIFKGNRLFLQNMDETLFCTKIVLQCLKYLHLKSKGGRLESFGSECKFIWNIMFPEGFKNLQNFLGLFASPKPNYSDTVSVFCMDQV